MTKKVTQSYTQASMLQVSCCTIKHSKTFTSQKSFVIMAFRGKQRGSSQPLAQVSRLKHDLTDFLPGSTSDLESGLEYDSE